MRPTVVRYGLSPGPPPSALPRARHGRTLLAVGRLEPQKGHDVLIDAVAQAIAGGADLRLDICGVGSQRASQQARIEHWGVGDRVRLLGQRDDAQRLMLEADALVHPDDEQLLVRLGAAGRERLCAVFPPERTARARSDVYDEALGCRA